MAEESRELLNGERKTWKGRTRLVELLKHLGMSSTTWYRKPDENPKPRKAELRQTKQLFDLLPRLPNELWQMDVTYIHMPQGTWWYAATVIDYYSRYLLACELKPFQNAVSAMAALDVARAKAEQLHGPLTREPILRCQDNVEQTGKVLFAGEIVQSHMVQKISNRRLPLIAESSLNRAFNF